MIDTKLLKLHFENSYVCNNWDTETLDGILASKSKRLIKKLHDWQINSYFSGGSDFIVWRNHEDYVRTEDRTEIPQDMAHRCCVYFAENKPPDGVLASFLHFKPKFSLDDHQYKSLLKHGVKLDDYVHTLHDVTNQIITTLFRPTPYFQLIVRVHRANKRVYFFSSVIFAGIVRWKEAFAPPASLIPRTQQHPATIEAVENILWKKFPGKLVGTKDIHWGWIHE